MRMMIGNINDLKWLVVDKSEWRTKRDKTAAHAAVDLG